MTKVRIELKYILNLDGMTLCKEMEGIEIETDKTMMPINLHTKLQEKFQIY